MNPIDFRRHIHRHPELSYKEEATASFIEAELTKLGITHRRVATTGILATIEGRGELKRAVVLRADIDALPIDEQNTVEFKSQNAGVMHACGHDIHAAVLFGVVQRMAQNPNFEGTLLALFQPGEECNPGGASLVLAEDPFAGYDVVAIVGEHVEAQLPVGSVGFREGKYMASSDELRFEVRGKGGHGALRQLIKDPVAAMAAFTLRLLELNREDLILSIGKIEAAGATNVIPHSVYMEGTLRTFDEGDRASTKERIAEIAQEIDSQYGTHIEVNISHGYPTVVNDSNLTKVAREVASTIANEVADLPLRTTSEDFGFYGLHYPALFYRLGVGPDAGAPHTSTFCPNEGSITVGVELMEALALRFLNYEK